MKQRLFIGILTLFLSHFGFSQSIDRFVDVTIKVDSLNVPLDSKQSYFPQELLEPKEQTPKKKKEGTQLIDADFRSSLPAAWYSRFLFAMKEPLLFNQKTTKQMYRFTWLRTFHKPMTFRIEKRNDYYALYWKVLSGKGGYAPGTIEIERHKILSEKEWNTFTQYIEKANFWEMELGRNAWGTDGAEWIMEGMNQTEYRVVSVWSPNKGGFYNACTYLISLTNMDIPEKYKY